MAFAETGFGKTFAAFGPVPAEQLADRLPAPEAGVFYVVAGADSWLRQQTLRRLADHHLGEPPAPFRLRRFDGRTANADQVVSATRTVSFSGAPVGSRVGAEPRPQTQGLEGAGLLAQRCRLRRRGAGARLRRAASSPHDPLDPPHRA